LRETFHFLPLPQGALMCQTFPPREPDTQLMKQSGMEDDMKVFECGTLVPGCGWKTTSDNDAEIVQHAVQHLKSAHNETHIRPSIIDAIKQRVREESRNIS
jgi:predicted small metal-binding protein